jgi:hypothetical protein
MTPEFFIGVVITSLVATVGYFLKALVTKTDRALEVSLAMHETLKGATEAIVQLQQSDRETSRQIINIVERLVRLEERAAR